MSETEPFVEPRTKSELMDNVRRGQQLVEQTIASLTPEELAQPGLEGQWSVKDHLAHLSAWENMIVARMRGHSPWEAMGISEQQYHTDEDTVNALVYQQWRDRPLQEVLSALQNAHHDVLHALQTLPEQELQRQFTSRSGETYLFQNTVIGNTYGHALEHLQWIGEMLQQRQNRRAGLGG